jgi:uncharacterized protein
MKIKKLIKLIGIIIVLGVLFVGYCYLETRWIKLTKIDINSTEIPDSFNKLKIVFISDIHHGPYLSLGRVNKLVNRINKLKPDLIIMGGDYVHRDPKYIIPVFDELLKLKAKLGIYAVLGNHDHWENAELTRQMMERNGIKNCDNKSYWVKIAQDSIKIGGVGDLWEDNQIIENSTADLKENNFCILISHNPDYLEYLKTDLFDLTLSGHIHGGQITFFGIWAPIVPSKYGQKYRYGLKTFGKMKSYITSGIGTITPPLRFCCRPEIVIFELNKPNTPNTTN